MTTGGTRLLTGTALSAEDLRRVRFPMTVLGGYRVADVEAFRTRVVRAIGQLYEALEERRGVEQELVAEVKRLNEAKDQSAAAPVALRVTSGQRALGVLATAEHNAERVLADAQQQARQITGEAQHQSDQMRAHAEMQAEEILRQATEQAETERARIISDASAEGRRTASGFRVLAEEMGSRLHELAGQVATYATEWDGRAAEATAPARSPRSGNGRRAAQAAG